MTNEPVKRLRRWAKETTKVSGPPNSSQTPNTTADEFPKHVLNRSDSSLSADTPKERMGMSFFASFLVFCFSV